MIEDAKHTNKRLSGIDFELSELNKLKSISNNYFDCIDTLVKDMNAKTIADARLFKNIITQIKCSQICLSSVL